MTIPPKNVGLSGITSINRSLRQKEDALPTAKKQETSRPSNQPGEEREGLRSEVRRVARNLHRFKRVLLLTRCALRTTDRGNQFHMDGGILCEDSSFIGYAYMEDGIICEEVGYGYICTCVYVDLPRRRCVHTYS